MSSQKVRKQASAAPPPAAALPQPFRLQKLGGSGAGVAESILLEPARLELIEKGGKSSNSGGGSIKQGQSGCSKQARLHPVDWLPPEQSFSTVQIQKFGTASKLL